MYFYCRCQRRNILGAVDTLHTWIIGNDKQNQGLFQDTHLFEMFLLIHNQLLNSLQSFDNIPSYIFIVCRDRIHKKWIIDDINSHKAVLGLNRFQMLDRQIHHNFV